MFHVYKTTIILSHHAERLIYFEPFDHAILMMSPKCHLLTPISWYHAGDLCNELDDATSLLDLALGLS